jgi:hypothetical protein
MIVCNFEAIECNTFFRLARFVRARRHRRWRCYCRFALAPASDYARFGFAGGAGDMDLNWIVLGLVGWALALLGVLVLMRMTSDQDRAARHEEKRLIPYSDVTITHHSNG